MTVVGYTEEDLKAFVQGVFCPEYRTIVTGGVALDAHPLRRRETGGRFTRSHDDLNVLVLDTKVLEFIERAKAFGMKDWGIRGKLPIATFGEFTVELWPYMVDKEANTYTVNGNKGIRSYPLELIDGQRGRILDTYFTIAANEQLKYDALKGMRKHPEDLELIDRLAIRDDLYVAITEENRIAATSPRITALK